MTELATKRLEKRQVQARERWQRMNDADLRITVGTGTCGLAAGAQETLGAIQAELNRRGLEAVISQVGCVGMCSYEPMIELQAKGRPRINYGQATENTVPEIFAAYFEDAPLEQAVVVGEVIATTATSDGHALHSLSFVVPETQQRIAFQQNSCASSSATAD